MPPFRRAALCSSSPWYVFYVPRIESWKAKLNGSIRHRQQCTMLPLVRWPSVVKSMLLCLAAGRPAAGAVIRDHLRGRPN